MLALAALAILGASGAAIAYFVTTPRTAAVEVEAAPALPVFHPIDAFTVTLNRDHSERLLHVGLTLEVADEASRKRINDFLPVIRSQVLVLLGEQNADQVQTAEGKRKLADDVRQAINTVFDGRGAAPVTRVLFNAFVVQ